MTILNRKNQTIEEIENHYSNKKTRTGMAWVMATASLVVTVAVISVLFFGGRWGYRKITTDKKPDSTSATLESGTKNSGNQAGESKEDFPSVVTDQAASTIRPDGARVAPPPPRPTTSNNSIPDTGAGEVIIIAPLSAAIVGYFVARRRQQINGIDPQ